MKLVVELAFLLFVGFHVVVGICALLLAGVMFF
jgi:hypothetical protein